MITFLPIFFLFGISCKYGIKIDLTPTKSVSALSLISMKHYLKGRKIHSPYKEIITKKYNAYSGKVAFGNPPQILDVVFDTGSANIIVDSSFCNTLTCNKHNKFDINKSKTHMEITYADSTFKDSDIITSDIRDETQIYFGTGEVKCYFGNDNVCINGFFCANNITLLEAYDMSTIPFQHVDFDGIIGLSFTHLSISKNSNFLEVLYLQKKIKKRIFSFYFNKDDKKNSLIYFGGYDKKLFTGDILYTNVISNTYWEISIEGIYYGDELIVPCDEKNCTAIVDSGTSMLASPSSVYEILKDRTDPGITCININNLKPIVYKINGTNYTIEPEFYIFTLPSESTVSCINAVMEINLPTEENKLVFILGIPFLKKYYSVFDREENKIGFAQAVY